MLEEYELIVNHRYKTSNEVFSIEAEPPIKYSFIFDTDEGNRAFEEFLHMVLEQLKKGNAT